MSTKAELEAEVARLTASAEAGEPTEVVESDKRTDTEEAPEKPKRQTLRLQSRYKQHVIVIRPTRRVFHPQLGYTETIPGISVKFEGPQRIFDSQYVAEREGWDEETLNRVEQTLVKRDSWLTDYYLAPLSPLPEHLYEYARILPPSARPKCQAFWYEEGTKLVQCSADATAGRMYCHTHDPDQPRIIHGGGTTK